jgi:hypothetical protein
MEAGVLTRLWRRRPSLALTFAFSLAWAATVTLGVMGQLWLMRLGLPPTANRIMAIVALGALAAAPVALWLASMRTAANRRAGFATMFVLLVAITPGLTALLFALDFWWYFAEWHGERFSRLWMIQLAFTAGSAVYQFLVSGLRLYVPSSIIAAMLASIWWARRSAN